VSAVEHVEDPTVASLATVQPSSSLVRAAAPVTDVEAAFREYTTLCDRLLDDSDIQQIQGKPFRKKSAWRKLAVAFGVSCKVVDRQYERNDAGRIIRAEVLVTATAPNGRSMDGLGACDLFEKCCPPGCFKKRYSDHTCCAADCSGAVHFSNPQHDLPATAATRATNRACADLFGMGEVSAEEVSDRGQVIDVGNTKSQAKPGQAVQFGSCDVCGKRTQHKVDGHYRHGHCKPDDQPDDGRPFEEADHG
jgi:hypothetical protein